MCMALSKVLQHDHRDYDLIHFEPLIKKNKIYINTNSDVICLRLCSAFSPPFHFFKVSNERLDHSPLCHTLFLSFIGQIVLQAGACWFKLMEPSKSSTENFVVRGVDSLLWHLVLPKYTLQIYTFLAKWLILKPCHIYSCLTKC